MNERRTYPIKMFRFDNSVTQSESEGSMYSIEIFKNNKICCAVKKIITLSKKEYSMSIVSEKHNIAAEHIIPSMVIMLIKLDHPPELKRIRRKKKEKERIKRKSKK